MWSLGNLRDQHLTTFFRRIGPLAVEKYLASLESKMDAKTIEIEWSWDQPIIQDILLKYYRD